MGVPRAVRAITAGGAFLLASLVLLAPVHAVPLTVGNAQTVVRDVNGSLGTDFRTIIVDSDLFQDEEVTTKDNSAVRIIFKDGTVLSIGENSRLKLTRLVFDPDPAKSKVAVKMLSGVFRWSSGNLPSNNYGIATPVATVGVRGTVVEFVVLGDGTTTVALTQGQVVVGNLKNDTVTLDPGEATTIFPPDGANKQAPPSTPGAAPPGFFDAVRKMTITLRMNDAPSDIQPAGGPGAGKGVNLAGSDTQGGGGGGGDPDGGSTGGGGPLGSTPFNTGGPPRSGTTNNPSTTTTGPTVDPTTTSPAHTTVTVTPPSGPTRIGTKSSATLTIERDDATGQLHVVAGNLSGPFSGPGTGPAGVTLGANGKELLTYIFIPTKSGDNTSNLAISFQDSSASQLTIGGSVINGAANDTKEGIVVLTGKGVGPQAATNHDDGAIKFGLIQAGTMKTLDLDIKNISKDVGFDKSLTGLTLLTASITGAKKDRFSIDGFTPGTVLMPGEDLILHITYSALLNPGTFIDALLTIGTDEGAEFGSHGNDLVFTLTAGTLPIDVVSIAEPATFGLLAGPAIATLAILRRRRDRTTGRSLPNG